MHDQVDEIIIVDNGSAPTVKNILAQPEIATLIGLETSVNVIVSQENEGIASGFNRGIEASRQRGAKLVLLLDHDSVPVADMVTTLFAGYQLATANNAGSRVAAVGPRIVDSRDHHDYPFIRFGWLRNQHIRCADSQ